MKKINQNKSGSGARNNRGGSGNNNNGRTGGKAGGKTGSRTGNSRIVDGTVVDDRIFGGNQSGGKKKSGFNAGYTGGTKRSTVKNNTVKKGAANSGGRSGRAGGGFVTGRIDGSHRGFAFLLNEGGDLYISKENLGGARHGDTVKAIRTGDKAVVKEILTRGSNVLVGTYYESGSRAYVAPDDSHFPAVAVNMGASKTGEKVVISFKPNGDGQIIETLGMADEEGVDLKSIIRSFDLHESFPKSVLKDADRFSGVGEDEIKGREDFRKEIAFTIDGEDSRDFDDAVSIRKIGGNGGKGKNTDAETDIENSFENDGIDGSGNWQDGDGKARYVLTVHIADVAHYVTAGSPLDKEAFARGTSVYFPFATLPMLPAKLSEELCCLKEGEDRLTLSVVMYIDSRGKVVKHRVTEGVINCAKRLTYNQAALILDAATAAEKPDTAKQPVRKTNAGKDAKSMPEEFKRLAAPLKHMHELCMLLLARRKDRGAIDFESDEPEITMKDGKVLNVKKANRLISHKMIEEFMILTNETVAKHFFTKKTPFIYRGHAAPPEEKIERLESFLATLGVDFDYQDDGPLPEDFARLLESVPADLKGVISSVALRAMTKAVYEPESNGHFGLALKRYCHFTAPIRRYPDLFIHRVIKESLKGGEIKKYGARAAEASTQSSLRERLAEEASRRVDDLLVAKYMSQFIGETFEGIVSGVTDWGVFVRLDNTAEGLIRTEKMSGEYVFDERSMSLSGVNNYRMGQRVKVRLSGVSGDRIEFLPETEK